MQRVELRQSSGIRHGACNISGRQPGGRLHSPNWLMNPRFAMMDPGIFVWKPSMHAAIPEIAQNSTAWPYQSCRSAISDTTCLVVLPCRLLSVELGKDGGSQSTFDEFLIVDRLLRAGALEWRIQLMVPDSDGSRGGERRSHVAGVQAFVRVAGPRTMLRGYLYAS